MTCNDILDMIHASIPRVASVEVSKNSEVNAQNPKQILAEKRDYSSVVQDKRQKTGHPDKRRDDGIIVLYQAAPVMLHRGFVIDHLRSWIVFL